MQKHHPRHLALLPGPAAENADLVSRLITQVMDDYAHWRRNLHPDDPSLLPPSQRVGLQDVQNELEDQVTRLVAQLKRSFPFHSPRYLAHMQSETTIPSLVGSLAGMLYNANNVTSESGAVTLQLEVEACNRLLEMIGYRPPPTPPERPTHTDIETYLDELTGGFGWCHLTSGGTSANIEALWGARNVRLNTLAIRDALQRANRSGAEIYDLTVSSPGSGQRRSLAKDADRGGPSDHDLLGLLPDEAIELLGAYYQVVAGTPPANADQGSDKYEQWRTRWKQADNWLRDARKQLPLGGFPFRPVVFYPGTAHYSIEKAIDVLGLGADSAVRVETDLRHRMDIDDLRIKLGELPSDAFPLAVVAVAGTTEEGAVDPLDKLMKLRDDSRADGKAAFWVHADAAWGGYIRSMLTLSERRQMHLECQLFKKRNDAPWDSMFGSGTTNYLPGGEPRGPAQWLISFKKWATHLGVEESTIESDTGAFEAAVEAKDWAAARRAFHRLVGRVSGTRQHIAPPPPPTREDVRKHLTELFENERYLSAEETHLVVRLPQLDDEVRHKAELPVFLADDPVLQAFDALSEADSVTVDPHKLGYQHYACGAIAFRSDAVRDHVMQSAPYITTLGGQTVAHQPLWRLRPAADAQGDPRRELVAPAGYTLEGSRPSAPAAALWLSTSVLPLDNEHHGLLVREGYFAAQELAAWLQKWEQFEREIVHAHAPGEPDQRDEGVTAPTFEFVSLTWDDDRSVGGDTNVVIFGVRPGRRDVACSLEDYNSATKAVYDNFAILAERGEHRHSYGQPFFLSKTEFKPDGYSPKLMARLAKQIDVSFDADVYERDGLGVIRAAVMNPYIRSLRKTRGVDVLAEFMVALAATARRVTEAKPVSSTAAEQR